jgi:hypothetical protein
MRTLGPVLALLLGLPVVARATPTFPDAIQRALTAAQAPPCAICHAGGVTGRGTVTTAFGQAIRARGLVANDETSLGKALAQMEADRVDSNGDGVLDVDELRAGEDPNAGAGQVQVAYGCALGSRGGLDDVMLEGLLVLVLVLVLVLETCPRTGPRARARARDDMRRASTRDGFTIPRARAAARRRRRAWGGGDRTRRRAPARGAPE